MTDVPNMTSDAVLHPLRRAVPGIASILVLTLILFLTPISPQNAQAAGNSKQIAAFNRKYQEAQTDFQAQMEQLATECDQQRLKELSRDIRQWAVAFEQQPGDVDRLPSQLQADIPASLPMAEQVLRTQVRKVRVEYARQLYVLVLKAQAERYAGKADRLLREILFHDSDHKEARGLMGYRLIDNEWMTPFASRMKKEGKVWHPQFGWIEQQDVSRYEADERPLGNGKWVPAAQANQLRANFNRAWDIRTEHFFIRTNNSLEQGVELATQVEIFHKYFMKEFAAFFNTPQQLAKLLRSTDGDQHEIDYFRTQAEFVDAIKKHCPVASLIQGFYYPPSRKAYFFHNPEAAPEAARETLFHEVTHQLLSESSKQPVSVGHDRDFWVVEGLACYLESFQVMKDGTFSVGNVNHPRMQAARSQIVVRENYEPIARFSLLGRLKYQQGEPKVLQDRYAQSTGLAHFFMHYQEGVYKDGFIEFLSQIYSPDQRVRAKAKPVYEIIGVSDREIDTQYQAYIKAMGPLDE
jgi:hypothetical protein